MTVFSSNDVSVEAWGPTAAVTVTAEALGGVINDSWLLVGFTVNASEITDVRQCFNDMSYIYALGNDQGRCLISLEFAILIGKKNCSSKGDNTKAIDDGLGNYVKGRVSQKKAATTITIGGFSRKGWLKGIRIGNLDPAKGICYGTVEFIMELGGSDGGGGGSNVKS